MLAELKAAPLLNGFRGAAKADVPALSQLISQVSALAAQQESEISEIELNPVLVHAEGQGVTIVDALVVRRKATRMFAYSPSPLVERVARCERRERRDG